MAQPCVLLKHGELAIKGRNRNIFERQLLRNLKHAVAEVDPNARIERRSGVAVVTASGPQQPLVDRLREVIGISVVQPGYRVPKNPEQAARMVVQMLRERYGGEAAKKFAIKARRRDKAFQMSSSQLAGFIGQRVCDELNWPVDLSNPEVEVFVEVDWREIFISVEHLRGQGGLPVGSSGRALALLSGGYDSPVAAYRMMKRGLRCDFVHFTGAPFTGPSSTYKAYALVRRLNQFQGNSKLHVVPVGKAQRALATAGAGELQIVAQRRLFVRIADVLAQQLNAQALITGDSLGQVSSQTLSNMATTEQASSLPLLRPLVGWDKTEIMNEARRIGTYDISKLPDEDCCSLIMPPQVATRSTVGQLSKVEGRVGVDSLLEQVLANVQVIDLGSSEQPVATCEVDSGSEPEPAAAGARAAGIQGAGLS